MTEREIAALHFATTDELTQLTNRRGFEILAGHVLSLCDRMGQHAVLLFFDLNDFKAINDRVGHAEGDRALKTFADTLTGALRDSDVIARLGGDEFVVLLSATDPADVAEPVERVTEALALRNTTDARGYAIRFSVGHVDYDPARHHVVADLLASADHRMYEDKQRGKTAGTQPRKNGRVLMSPRSRSTAVASLYQLPHGGALAIASAICSGVRSR